MDTDLQDAEANGSAITFVVAALKVVEGNTLSGKRYLRLDMRRNEKNQTDGERCEQGKQQTDKIGSCCDNDVIVEKKSQASERLCHANCTSKQRKLMTTI